MIYTFLNTKHLITDRIFSCLFFILSLSLEKYKVKINFWHYLRRPDPAVKWTIALVLSRWGRIFRPVYGIGAVRATWWTWILMIFSGNFGLQGQRWLGNSTCCWCVIEILRLRLIRRCAVPESLLLPAWRAGNAGSQPIDRLDMLIIRHILNRLDDRSPLSVEK